MLFTEKHKIYRDTALFILPDEISHLLGNKKAGLLKAGQKER
jgi:hypothetical protein